MHACGEFHDHYMAQVSIEAPQNGVQWPVIYLLKVLLVFTQFEI